jgi:lipooligosaccharide transport system ATP-binding protein
MPDTTQPHLAAAQSPEHGETSAAIKLVDVHKAFGEIKAVDGLTLEVPRGICLGLLGPNGAGKSTTMRLLTGQAIPDSGAIEVLGIPVPEKSKQARARMGVVPQQDNLNQELTCAQELRVWAALQRIPRKEREAAVDRALAIAKLQSRRDSRIDELSGGMKRRLLIARGLVQRPELVLLDEPTVGLDPQVRAELWSLISDLREAGVTVLMSTHYIEEAERLADDVAIVNHGKVIAQGSPSQLLATYVGERAREFYGPEDVLTAVELAAQDAGFPTRRTGPTVSVLRFEDAPLGFLTDLAASSERAATLEDVFVLLTGEVLD